MARLPRLILPHHPHLVVQRTLPQQALTEDDVDRLALAALMRDVLREHAVTLHAWAFQPFALALIATPERGEALAGLMQALARRHAAAFNRRHGRRGTLWEGRYRAAAFEQASWGLRAMLHVEAEGVPGWGSGAQHAGGLPSRGGLAVQSLPAYWALGNTPFDREAAYRRAMQEGLDPGSRGALESALRGGWLLGSPAFVEQQGSQVARPVLPRAKGRPRRAVQAVPK